MLVDATVASSGALEAAGLRGGLRPAAARWMYRIPFRRFSHGLERPLGHGQRIMSSLESPLCFKRSPETDAIIIVDS